MITFSLYETRKRKRGPTNIKGRKTYALCSGEILLGRDIYSERVFSGPGSVMGEGKPITPPLDIGVKGHKVCEDPNVSPPGSKPKEPRYSHFGREPSREHPPNSLMKARRKGTEPC